MSTVRIQIRRGLSTDWSSVNPVLAAGELGIETDSLQIKVGDGTSHWSTLGYATVTPGNLTDAINAAITGTIDVNFATISDLDTAISQEASDRTSAIATALSTAEGYTNTHIAALSSVYDAAGSAASAVTTAETSANSYTDGKIATEVTNRNSAIATAVSTAEGYTDTKITALVNGAPAVLDTLKELSDALGGDKNFATTVANHISAVTDGGTLHNATFTGTLTLPTGSITGSEIADQTIDAGKIVAGTITSDKIANNAIQQSQLQNGSVGTNQLINNSVTADKLANNSVTADKVVSIPTSKVTGLDTALTDISTTYATTANIVSTYAPISNPTFGGTVSLPSNTSIGTTTSTELGYVHGVTSAIQTQFGTAATNLSNHTSATTNVHGIADTSALATKSYVDTAVGTEATARSTALSTAEGYTDTAISTEVTNRNSAIATAKSQAISTSESYTDSSISTEVTNRNSAITTATANIVKTTDTGSVTSTMIADGTIVDADINASAAIAQSKISGLTTALAAKAPLASPTFTGTTTAADVTITGNLTVSGTTTTVNSTDLNISDTLIYLAQGNAANANDIGLIGHATIAGTYQHLGLIKDHSDGKWKLFSNVTTEPTSGTVSLTGATYDTLKAGAFEGNLTGNVTGDLTGNAGTVTNGVYLNATQTLANKTLTTPVLNGPSVNSDGITFSDGTVQTTTGVASITTIATPATTTSSFSATTYRDQFVPITGGNTYTITDAGCPIGLSVNFWQNAGTLGVIAVAGSGSATGATIVGTPGLKLRATNSVATAMKVSATTWILYGDLSA
jgi:hypothetical protein